MRHTTHFDTSQPLIYHLCTALKPIVCFLCDITSYTTPLASFNFDETSSTYCFKIYLHNKHSQYEAYDLLRYTPIPHIPPKPILCILCHITSYTTPSASFNQTRFDTSQPLIYHLCTALKPIVCFLCHITSYTTPLASFNFAETWSTYCF